MATKKKKTATPKRAPARRKPVKRQLAPTLSPATAPLPETGPSQNGGLYLLIAVVLLALGWFVWQRKQASSPSATAPVVAAPAPAANAEGAPPQARSIASPAPAAKAPEPTVSAKPMRRETAGSAPAAKAEASETGAPSLTYDRSLGQPLSVRAWRSEGGIATLDVFAPKNRLVRSIKSDAGKAGLVELKWDGKDEQGKKVPVGLYFLRPSQKEEQSIRDVWVKG